VRSDVSNCACIAEALASDANFKSRKRAFAVVIEAPRCAYASSTLRPRPRRLRGGGAVVCGAAAASPPSGLCIRETLSNKRRRTEPGVRNKGIFLLAHPDARPLPLRSTAVAARIAHSIVEGRGVDGLESAQAKNTEQQKASEPGSRNKGIASSSGRTPVAAL
jgi:hypothetical protein